MMFGYACSETEQLMPLPIMLAHQMAYRLTQRRKDGTIPFILPDGKTQVTVEYGEDGMPSRIDTIVISTQHYENATEEQLLESLTENVITPILKYAKHFAGVYGGDLDIDTYIAPEPKTQQQIADEEHVDLSTVFRDQKAGISKLSALIFGWLD